MTPTSKNGADDGDRLIELAHLSSAVAHSLINAFSAAVSNAELIRSPVSAAPDAKELEGLGTSIIDTALNASQIARKLIDWARSAGALDLEQSNGEPRTVDLNQLIGEVVDSEKRADEAGIDWVVKPGAIASIPGDAAHLRAMLVRFIQNAREALPGRRGMIEFSTHTDARNWVVVTIRDSGCGMSREVLSRAGEPFFSTKPDHAGVGLTIALVIWRRHRGAFSIESEPGEGTTIRLSIWPVSPDATGPRDK
jgi:two-component system, NtrC family, sensor kinase